MKRQAILGVVLLALSSVLLIGAGEKDDSGNLDPHSHKNVPFAVVKNETGANEKIYYGELAYEIGRAHV